jgi:hypothetical protein
MTWTTARVAAGTAPQGLAPDPCATSLAGDRVDLSTTHRSRQTSHVQNFLYSLLVRPKDARSAQGPHCDGQRRAPERVLYRYEPEAGAHPDHGHQQCANDVTV